MVTERADRQPRAPGGPPILTSPNLAQKVSRTSEVSDQPPHGDDHFRLDPRCTLAAYVDP
jgi:hypothetical protein